MKLSHILAEDRAAVDLAVTSNDVISDRLKDVALLMIADSEGCVAWHDVEIARVQKLLTGLQSQRSDHVARVQRYKSTVAGHRKIPNELLQEIFLRCSDDVQVLPDLNRAPWTLERVCSRWRTVAHATPKLWSNIRFRYLWNESNAAHHMTILKRLMWRTTDTLVSLDVDSRGLKDSSGAQLLVNFFREHSEKFERLSINVADSVVQRFFSLPSPLFSHLGALTVVQDGGNSELNNLSILQGARNLRNVVFNFPLPSDASLFDIPFFQLTNISLMGNCLPSDVIFEVLRQSSQTLVDCRLEISNIVDTPNPTSLAFPELKRLRLEIPRNTERVQHLWIPCLQLPRLATFELHAASTVMLWQSTWTPVIAHSRCLESLVLVNKIAQDILEEILVGTPFLVRLEMWCGTKLSDSMLHRMSLGDLLPQLSSLTCLIKTEESLNQHLEMLGSRRLKSNCAVEITNAVFNTTGLSIARQMLIGISKKHGVRFPGFT